MNATIKLLDKFASACSVAQDKDLAAKLRVTKSAVSNWRNGRAHPDAESIERMCEVTGEALSKWLPLIEAERARTPGAKKAWLRLAQAAASMLLVVTAAGPQRVEAHPISTGLRAIDSGATSIHYAHYDPSPKPCQLQSQSTSLRA